MRDSVTPAGMAVSALGAERHSSRDLPYREDEEPAGAEQPSANPAVHGTSPAPELPLDAPAATIPGTLFAASILGQRMRTFDQAVRTLHDARREPWTPPESSLHLKDRAI